MALQILDVEISARVNGKINQAHGLSRFDVEWAINDRWGARLAPDVKGVERLLIFGRAPNGTVLKISLYFGDQPGHWRLGTAFPVPG